ncbi:Ig-like domain-containing protein, partial [Pseudovibrio axinellae]|uniref:Ig-like domain-containing protein n=2 Tax=Pseudovibrio axinellae TaxID=989403 RepID=UPI0015877939
MSYFVALQDNAIAGTISCPSFAPSYTASLNIDLTNETCVADGNGNNSQIAIYNLFDINTITIETFRNNPSSGDGVSSLTIDGTPYAPDGSGKISEDRTCSAAGCTINVSGEFGVSGTFSITLNIPSTGVLTVPPFVPVNSAVPASISVTSGNNQSAPISSSFSNPLVVTVEDAGGNPVAGEPVTFTAPSSGAGLSSVSQTATTNSAGEASLSVSANASAGGPYTVEASVVGVGSTADFSLTNDAGAAASLSVTSGDNQNTTISSSFSNPLVVTVEDAGGNPVAGEPVTFTAPSSGAGLSSVSQTATTNSAGEASLSVSANASAGGPYTVEASV